MDTRHKMVLQLAKQVENKLIITIERFNGRHWPDSRFLADELVLEGALKAPVKEFAGERLKSLQYEVK